LPRPRTFKVLDGVYCIMRRSYFTCSYLVLDGDAVIAIDAGMKSTGADVMAALEEIGRPVTAVRAILLTHWHNDHSAGAAELAERSGAEVFFHSLEAPWFARATAASGIRARIAGMIPETGPLVLVHGLLENGPDRAVAATRHVQDGDVVAARFEVISTPGHTPGHVSFLDRTRRILFAGDALAVIRGQLRFMARPVTPDLEQARASMIRCLEHPLAAICPGHQEPMTANVEAERRRMLDLLRGGGRWPFLG
jgi:glyoxylase-like metal-dependent hydrolase (beta-lactamase superfamily II)